MSLESKLASTARITKSYGTMVCKGDDLPLRPARNPLEEVAGWASTIVKANSMRASDWRPYVKNTLRGFFDLTLASGMVLHDLTLHMKNDSRWVGLPAQRFIKEDGTATYTAMITFVDRATSDRFRDQALDALQELGVSA